MAGGTGNSPRRTPDDRSVSEADPNFVTDSKIVGDEAPTVEEQKRYEARQDAGRKKDETPGETRPEDKTGVRRPTQKIDPDSTSAAVQSKHVRSSEV